MEETRTMKCPKCGKEQPRADVCAVCGYDVSAHAARAVAEARKRREITCPKCRLVQPIRPICARCKFDIREYYNRKREEAGARRAAAGAPPSPAAPVAAPPPGGDLLSFEELFRRAWAGYKRRVVTVLLVMVLATLLAIAATAALPLVGILLALVLPGAKGAVIAIAALLASVVFLAAVGWAGAAITHAVADERVGLGVAFRNGWVHMWGFLWLYSLLGYLFPGAFMLFVVPGVVFTVWFGFAQYIVVVEDVRGTEALALSRAYVRGRFWDVFLRLFAVWIAAALVGAVPFIGPLLSLVFMPYPMLYTYLLYEDVRRVRGAVAHPYATTGEKAAWFGVATLGYVVVVAAIVLAMGTALMGIFGALPSMLGKGQFPIPGIEEDFFPRGEDEPSTSLPPGTLRPYEYEKFIGTWKATGLRDAGDWTFVFSPGYTMEARGPSDIWFRAETAVYMDVGARPGEDFVRVPPGAGIMDFTILGGSEPRYVGQVSLGAFKFEFENLTLCATEPGVLDRFESFEPTKKVACFEMTKTGGGPEAPSVPSPQAPPPPPPPQPSVQSGSAEGPALTGSARAVKDGSPVTYELATGFFSDTRFEDPRRATVEFRTAGAEKFSNPERVEVTLDATRRGIHFLDGPAINAAMFDGPSIAIGEDTPTGIIASMRFIAEGGQVFPPKDLCFITVKTAWSGAPGSVFAGSVSSCTMHSAGIDRVIEGMEFEVRVP